MRVLLIAVSVCLLGPTTVQATANYIVDYYSWNPDDAIAFADLFENLMHEMGYEPFPFLVTIGPNEDGDILYTLRVGNRASSRCQWNRFSATPTTECWECIYAAVVACATISETTDWHSDWLRIDFGDVWITYATESCQNLLDTFQSSPTMSVQELLEENMLIDYGAY